MENNELELNETTKNFLEAYAAHNWEAEPKKIFYRLYYDLNGHPTDFAMTELPGAYIEIDRETYIESDYNIKVIDGKIVKPQKNVLGKLHLSDHGYTTSTQNISVIVDDTEPNNKWSKD